MRRLAGHRKIGCCRWADHATRWRQRIAGAEPERFLCRWWNASRGRFVAVRSTGGVRNLELVLVGDARDLIEATRRHDMRSSEQSDPRHQGGETGNASVSATDLHRSPDFAGGVELPSIAPPAGPRVPSRGLP